MSSSRATLGPSAARAVSCSTWACQLLGLSAAPLLGLARHLLDRGRQLLRCSGRVVEFHTAVCIKGPGAETDLTHIDATRVRFRTLTRAEAERYVAADLPLDCAGSFKAERRGVLLLESIDSRDPTAIQGLPLIWLGRALIARGVPLL